MMLPLDVDCCTTAELAIVAGGRMSARVMISRPGLRSGTRDGSSIKSMCAFQYEATVPMSRQ